MQYFAYRTAWFSEIPHMGSGLKLGQKAYKSILYCKKNMFDFYAELKINVHTNGYF